MQEHVGGEGEGATYISRLPRRRPTDRRPVLLPSSGRGQLERSDMTLPYLFLGVRGKLRPPNGGPLNGGALSGSSIRPGETRVIEHDCYKKVVTPEDVEVFDLPDPGPEDREQYWEFKTR